MKKVLNVYLFLGSFLILSGCLKKQDLTETDFGPSINTDSLQSKMSDSIGQFNFDLIKQKEINIITARSSLQDGAFNDRYKQQLIVSQIEKLPTETIYSFLFNRLDLINTQNSVSTTSYQIAVTNQANNKITLNDFASSQFGEKAAETKPTPYFLFRAYAYFALQACREPKISCHNLKTTKRQKFLKPEQTDPTICPDASNCLIDLNQIEFDILDGNNLNENGKPQRTHYTFVVSPQLPFLSKVVKYCARGLVKIQDRKIVAEDCSDLDDFSYGQ